MKLSRFRQWIYGQIGPSVYEGFNGWVDRETPIEELDAGYLAEHWVGEVNGSFKPHLQYFEVFVAFEEELSEEEVALYQRYAEQSNHTYPFGRFLHWGRWSGCVKQWRDGDEIIAIKGSSDGSMLFEVGKNSPQIDLFATEEVERPLELARAFGQPCLDHPDELQQRILGHRHVGVAGLQV